MDPFRFTTLAHAGRSLLGPISPASRDALLARVPWPAAAARRRAVLDVGCGKGAWLLAAMARAGAQGTAIEPNPSFVAELRMQALARGLTADLRVEMTTADRVVLMPGIFDVAICVGATHALGGYAAALTALQRLLRPRGALVLGEGFWRRTPNPDYLAWFGADESMMSTLDATLAQARTQGWKHIAHHVSTQGEFDEYELGYAASLRHALAARPDDPDHAAFTARIDAHADAYARWGHDTFGFVTMVLSR